MNDEIWQTFDNLFHKVERQARRVEELEARLEALEKKLAEREQSNVRAFPSEAERPVVTV